MHIRLYFIMSIALLLGAGANLHPEPSGKEPEPPLLVSKEGYLNLSKDVAIKEATPKIFLPTQSRLIPVKETQREYFFAVELKDGSAECRIPKAPRYTMIMRGEKDGTVFLRGPIEAECVPLELPAGSELPVLRGTDEGWMASALSCDGVRFKVFVPRNTDGVRFSQKSGYDIFCEGQAKLGLAFYDGQWMPAKKASAAEDAERTKELKMLMLKGGTASGYITLRDGRTLHGKRKGSDSKRILFRTDEGEEIWIGPDDISPLSAEASFAKGRIEAAKSLFLKARALCRENRIGEAFRQLDAAGDSLKDVPECGKFGADSLESVRTEIEGLRSDMAKSIDSDGLALYDYKLFPKDALSRHLSAGHILFREATWLNPGQVCARCNASGWLTCLHCKGAGDIKEDCPNCEGGLTVCTICNGSGQVACEECKGRGAFHRTCSRCGGAGMVWRASGIRGVEPDSSGGPSISTGGGGAVIVRRAPSIVGPDAPYRYIQERCGLCNGSGFESIPCEKCFGKGYMVCPKLQKCSFCDGKGYFSKPCRECNGKGKVECPDCKGRGFSGEAQTLQDEKPPAHQ